MTAQSPRLIWFTANICRDHAVAGYAGRSQTGDRYRWRGKQRVADVPRFAVRPITLNVTLIEKRRDVGRGIAYHTANSNHLLNVRAAHARVFRAGLG